MSIASLTWTPAAPLSETVTNPGPCEGEAWRLVEAQHRISTMKLVDDAAEQQALEDLLDASKPPVPAGCRHLHYLLYTPFRYPARGDSRFRRVGRTAGVFYAAENIETAVAEVSFWRLLFFIESPGLAWPANPLEFTGFAVHYRAPLCLDLTRPPYDAQRERWRHPTEYGACHLLADEVRGQGGTVIRSVSARDPAEGHCVNILDCSAFASNQPLHLSTWHLKFSAAGVYARCEAPTRAISFGPLAFARDPRVAAFNWAQDR